jgi:leucyl/phenylalanyl-tRNA--protein transferase
MVLECASFRISHSLAKKLRQVARSELSENARVRIMTDTDFPSVIAACAAPRATERNTWISPAIQAAYLAWHKAGAVHSIETWVDGRLAGGLYGVCLGKFFFGESMFSRVTDSSKLALAYLTRFLQERGIHHIDCQQQTGHLASLGAKPMSREHFLTMLEHALKQPSPPWVRGQILHTGELAPAERITP